MNVSDPVPLAAMIALAALAMFNAYVSIRILAHRGLSRLQKTLQLAIIWLVPLIGVSLVHSIVFPRPPKPKDPGFELAP